MIKSSNKNDQFSFGKYFTDTVKHEIVRVVLIQPFCNRALCLSEDGECASVMPWVITASWRWGYDGVGCIFIINSIIDRHLKTTESNEQSSDFCNFVFSRLGRGHRRGSQKLHFCWSSNQFCRCEVQQYCYLCSKEKSRKFKYICSNDVTSILTVSDVQMWWHLVDDNCQNLKRNATAKEAHAAAASWQDEQNLWNFLLHIFLWLTMLLQETSLFLFYACLFIWSYLLSSACTTSCAPLEILTGFLKMP